MTDVAPVLTPASRYAHDAWGDLRLLLLTYVGRVPSHEFRNACYRRAGLELPRTSSIHWRARFYAPENVRIGPFTTIGHDAFLDGREGIWIGESVNIAAEVAVYTREHDVQSSNFAETGGPVRIDDYAYIGSRVTILPGVDIGRGAVVASGAVCTKSVPPLAIVGGIPARTLGERQAGLNYRLGYRKRFQ